MTARRQNKSPLSPIIVLGMHRSGTTLIAQLLQDMGVFMGRRLDANYESIFFLRLNTWMLKQAGTNWEHPEPYDRLLSSSPARSMVLHYLRAYTDRPWTLEYLGLAGLSQNRGSLSRISGLWGWKDPRTTLTLPMWLDLFPMARIIYVERSGLAVALSLRRRQEMQFAMERQPNLYSSLRRGRPIFPAGLRFQSIESGLRLWADYCERADAHLEEVEGAVLRLRYEDMIRDPIAAVSALRDFIEPPEPWSGVHQVASRIQKTADRGHHAHGGQLSRESISVLERRGYGAQ